MSPIPGFHDVNITINPVCCNNDNCPSCCTGSPETPENNPVVYPTPPDFSHSPVALHRNRRVQDVSIPVILPTSPDFSPRESVRFHYEVEEKIEAPERVKGPDVTKEKTKKCCVIM